MLIQPATNLCVITNLRHLLTRGGGGRILTVKNV